MNKGMLIILLIAMNFLVGCQEKEEVVVIVVEQEYKNISNLISVKPYGHTDIYVDADNDRMMLYVGSYDNLRYYDLNYRILKHDLRYHADYILLEDHYVDQYSFDAYITIDGLSIFVEQDSVFYIEEGSNVNIEYVNYSAQDMYIGFIYNPGMNKIFKRVTIK